MIQFFNTEEFAISFDDRDTLAPLRDEFAFPQHDGSNVVYFTGNSLGLLPRSARKAVEQEFIDWQEHGVEGHFRAASPWYSYHTQFAEPLARLTGALPTEVVAMNSLTVNVHLMMSSFYNPNSERNVILLLGQEFPSDRYAAQSQVQSHGLNFEDCIVELHPREGEVTLRIEDICATIEHLGSRLALVHLSAVHYYTGQFYDIPTITKSAHQVGAYIGWDLAHAIGNVPLQLHNWDVDYATWCSYKYLNSGPGGVGGCFVHERHCTNPSLVRLAGWWGNDATTRFTMPKWFTPTPTAESWQLSNAPVFPMAIHRASLDIFDKAGIHTLREKSISLTAYLEFIINDVSSRFPEYGLDILTPKNAQERGAQLSTTSRKNGRELYEYLTANGVITDWRNPNVIRMAPAPLYCSFHDIWRFGQVFTSYCSTQS